MAYLIKQVLKTSRMAGFYRMGYSSVCSPLIFSEEVRVAKAERKPIVALESTIITHGMPYPQNLETAIQVENIIRKRGAIPATIAILKGQLTVGLTEEQIKYLAQAKGVVKASRRDLAPIAAAKLDGATTVAGTIIAAELADIPIFVTGGIGGVHRKGENTLDISADLNELGRSKTLVVCSGVKSILDIGKTLEYLETQGVCVCAFGDSMDFPAFYTRKSGFVAPHRVIDALHAAKLLHAARSLQLASGIVIAVPIPSEHSMNEKNIEENIRRALKEAEEKGIRGKEVTPYILSVLSETTDGASLNSNIALIMNNAKVGADVAIEYKNLKNADNSRNPFNNGALRDVMKSTTHSARSFHSSSCVTGIFNNEAPMIDPQKINNGDVLVIGGANVDRTYRLKEERIQWDGSTHACNMEQCGGGVGRNIAEALWRLRDGRTRLLTALADDADGQYLEAIAPGLVLDGCTIKGARTPTYAAVLDSRGECLLGLGDMALHDHITVDLVTKHQKVLESAPLVVLDGNIPQPTIDYILTVCDQLEKPVFFEPTDRRKATKILNKKQNIHFASPNLSELRQMARILNPDIAQISKNCTMGDDVNKCINEIVHLSTEISRYIKLLIVTIGSRGVVTIKNSQHGLNYGQTKNNLIVRHYPTNPMTKIENVSGAGDCFSSGVIYGLISGFKESQCMAIGFRAAKMTLLSKNTVSLNLSSINSSIWDEAHYECVETK